MTARTIVWRYTPERTSVRHALPIDDTAPQGYGAVALCGRYLPDDAWFGSDNHAESGPAKKCAHCLTHASSDPMEAAA